LTARNTASTSLLRDAVTAEPCAARHRAAKKHTRWALAAAVGGAAAVGAIAASAGAAHAATPADSRPDLTSQMLAVKPIIALPAVASGQATAPSAASTASSAPAHATAGHAAPAQHAVAKPATAPKPAAPATPSVIYDSVTPSSIPAGADAAVYADGTYQASAAQVAGHEHVLWIDTNGSRTDANALDVEPGDATPAGAAAWVQAKLTQDPGSTAIVYTFQSDWDSVISNIDALPAWMHSHVKYWIADPTGTPHILPGAAATQWYWGANYDISSAQPGFIK
jgi:hypothetical protein